MDGVGIRVIARSACLEVLRIKTLPYGRVRVKGYNAPMILNPETREQVSAGGAGLEHPPRQDTLTFFQGSALNYGNYLDEVWTLDERSGGITVADLNDGTGGQRHFYHSNTLYSVYALTDESGAIAEAVQSYDAYGKISALITGAGTDTTWFTGDDVLATNPNVSAIGNPWFYTGQRIDPETGLQFSKNRYLSVDLGRWMSRDSRGYDDGLNLYAYAKINPTKNLDQLGLLCDTPFPDEECDENSLGDVATEGCWESCCLESITIGRVPGIRTWLPCGIKYCVRSGWKRCEREYTCKRWSQLKWDPDNNALYWKYTYYWDPEFDMFVSCGDCEELY